MSRQTPNGRQSSPTVGPQWGGTTPVDAPAYLHLAGLAGPWLAEARPHPESLNALLAPRPSHTSNEIKAIYIVTNRHGNACYVGQTRPTHSNGDAAARRLRQHLTDPSKRREWQCYWVLPLLDETPAGVLDALEKAICLRLAVPLRHDISGAKR
jgi:hypothetical protein